MNAPTLDDLKRDISVLLNVLNLDRAGNHCPCRFCGSSDAISVQKGDNGAYFYCHACEAKGDVFRALALADGISNGAAIQRLTGNAKATFPRRNANFVPTLPREPVAPVPNTQLCNDLFALAVENILQGRADNRMKARGIHSTAWNEAHPILGWVDRLVVPGWKYPLTNAWLFRVTDAKWDWVTLKAHKEKPFDGPKSLFLPVGTEPADKPRHYFPTFWPPPEAFEPSEQLYLFEGELKAAAALAEGLAATSPTVGAGHKWTPGQIERFKGRSVFIVFDDDKAGHKFKNNALAALLGRIAEIKSGTF